MKTIRRMFAAVLGAALLLLCPKPASAGDPKTDMKDYLTLYDSLFLESFALEVKATMPTHLDGHHGVSQARLRLAGDASGKYLEVLREQIEPIKYNPSDPKGSYDKEKNFVFGYDKLVSVQLGESDWRVRHDAEVRVIAPNGQSAKAPQMAPARLEIYPVGHQDPASLFYRYILGLGRGYSQLIQEVTEVSVDERGLATVKAKGSFFSPHGGTWTLLVDTAADYLVRKASFVLDGTQEPTFTCESVKLHKEPFACLEEGTLTIADYAIKVSLKSFEKPSTPAGAALADPLKAETASRIKDEAQLPAGSDILDFRLVDGDRMPQIRKVRRQ